MTYSDEPEELIDFIPPPRNPNTSSTASIPNYTVKQRAFPTQPSAWSIARITLIVMATTGVAALALWALIFIGLLLVGYSLTHHP